MLVETKPNLKVIKLESLTEDIGIEIPAMHAIDSIQFIARSIVGPHYVYGLPVSTSDWKAYRPQSGMRDSAYTFNITGIDWTNLELDMLIVLVDLSV